MECKHRASAFSVKRPNPLVQFNLIQPQCRLSNGWLSIKARYLTSSITRTINVFVLFSPAGRKVISNLVWWQGNCAVCCLRAMCGRRLICFFAFSIKEEQQPSADYLWRPRRCCLLAAFPGWIIARLIINYFVGVAYENHGRARNLD